jgi:hypothetical protein
VKVIEAHRELTVRLEKFKDDLLDLADWSLIDSILRGAWKNKAEHICRGVMDQDQEFMEEYSIGSQQEGQLDPLTAALGRTTELAQLVEGYELEPFEVELEEIIKELDCELDDMGYSMMYIMEPEWICVQIGICPEVHTAETKAEPANIVINTVQKWEMDIMYV